MACSFRRRPLLAAPLLFAAPALLAAPAPRALRIPVPSQASLRQPISLQAQSSQIDYGTNQLIFHKVTITQGTMSVSADLAHATGLNFDDSRWVFRGDVHIVVNQGDLRSADAEITFARKVLARAIVTGTPARFSQVDPKYGQLVQGHSARIDYDVGKGVVVLSGGAWLSDGRNEISGQTLKYDIAAQSVIAIAADQNSQRVRITITPPPSHKP